MPPPPRKRKPAQLKVKGPTLAGVVVASRRCSYTASSGEPTADLRTAGFAVGSKFVQASTDVC